MGKIISHKRQQQIWEREHKKPYIFLTIDSNEPSGGVVLFWNWLKNRNKTIDSLRGIEMGCGKGRNSIWLAQQGANMDAFDFSKAAVLEARKRAKIAGVKDKVNFIVHDAIKSWPFESGAFDFAIDCFTSPDIETFTGRSFARDEFVRVLKPQGYLLVYTLSTDDEFHKEMLRESPAAEKNSFFYPKTGKFEKIFDQKELMEFYKGLNLIEERRMEKRCGFFGKDYNCRDFWVIFQK